MIRFAQRGFGQVEQVIEHFYARGTQSIFDTILTEANLPLSES